MASSQASVRRSTNNSSGYDNVANFNTAQASMLRNGLYVSNAPSGNSVIAATDALSALNTSFGNMSLRAPSFGSMTNSSSQYSGQSGAYTHYPSMPVAPQQSLMFPGIALQQHGLANSNNFASAAMYPAANHYMQPGYAAYGHAFDQTGPIVNNFTPRGASGEMPTLITPRRDSNSSAEVENIPGTPYNYNGNFNGNVTVMNRSPSAVYTHSTTPSPSQFMPGYGMPAHAYVKNQDSVPFTLPMHIQLLLDEEPRIPPAIPAPSSPLKPLDRSLENKNGETNVYLRGLMPETTDDMLFQWGRRFGDIQSSKAIIDLKTDFCKGFGFIKYHNFEDAENCIRGFHALGYEVSFARESFYAKLKKFSDETNTNLYVSNIPRSMNEHDLSLIFLPHEVCSARILRDTQGNGRGVGFARFESRAVCEEVIKEYNNKVILKGDSEYTIQIRYSDTHEQKSLKQQTAAARQYRAAEFEYGVMQARGLASPLYASGVPKTEFEAHLRQDTGYIPRFIAPAFRSSGQSVSTLSATSNVPRFTPSASLTQASEAETDVGSRKENDEEATEKIGDKIKADAHADSNDNDGSSDVDALAVEFSTVNVNDRDNEDV